MIVANFTTNRSTMSKNCEDIAHVKPCELLEALQQLQLFRLNLG